MSIYIETLNDDILRLMDTYTVPKTNIRRTWTYTVDAGRITRYDTLPKSGTINCQHFFTSVACDMEKLSTILKEDLYNLDGNLVRFNEKCKFLCNVMDEPSLFGSAFNESDIREIHKKALTIITYPRMYGYILFEDPRNKDLERSPVGFYVDAAEKTLTIKPTSPAKGIINVTVVSLEGENSKPFEHDDPLYKELLTRYENMREYILNNVVDPNAFTKKPGYIQSRPMSIIDTVSAY